MQTGIQVTDGAVVEARQDERSVGAEGGEQVVDEQEGVGLEVGLVRQLGKLADEEMRARMRAGASGRRLSSAAGAAWPRDDLPRIPPQLVHCGVCNTPASSSRGKYLTLSSCSRSRPRARCSPPAKCGIGMGTVGKSDESGPRRPCEATWTGQGPSRSARWSE